MAKANAVKSKEPLVKLGNVDGVEVMETDTGFEIAFDHPDRQLAKMMREVPGADLNKEAGVWAVPQASEEILAKAVSDIRMEHKAIAGDLASIKELAAASASRAQRDNGAASGVKPLVSDFRETGKFYGGEILNANARFAAQLTGFGDKDGAAFVTIHRLADLDKKMMKGEVVGIKYNDKYLGSVSDLSKSKSAADLATEFESNQGVVVDGVTVTLRGDKIGVAFDINPTMVARIKRIDGAEFHKEDKLWEVPIGAKDFALRAAHDIRQEFVADGKEVVSMKEIAEQKLDGARVSHAFTKDGQEHFGQVIAVSDRYVLQKGGMDNFKLHHRASLDEKSPEIGSNLSIKYNKGAGAVVDLNKQKEQSRALGR